MNMKCLSFYRERNYIDYSERHTLGVYYSEKWQILPGKGLKLLLTQKHCKDNFGDNLSILRV